ncbi:cytoplasmic tRNA 2-thiolation protein 2 isoform X28 [Apodemus sylvaticus]|uniref:cytoplasmic tRNA 2-thiolation protein 2 isoform X27 n=1 Tax=Apodemus sylvaticus TaxID=10129 RepID=UPI002244C7EF|nr:cytoplasmic tRNA 2-thiolation protein 2 isoform X27 [Apodemus sylvaticus]XP_052022758.1 cytoplasmic tRNA 2-thiolation protein 2 isoform X28 [Apodemus sylvaticus]
MCQAGEDYPGPAQREPPPVPRSSREQKCVKCTEGLPVVVIRAGDAFCRDCFKAFYVHKFRAMLGKNRVIFPGEKVLLSWSGGPSSSSMVWQVLEGLSQDSAKRLRFVPGVIYVDEGAACGQSSEDRAQTVAKVQQILENTGFPWHVVALEEVFSLPPSVLRVSQKPAGTEEAYKAAVDSFLQQQHVLGTQGQGHLHPSHSQEPLGTAGCPRAAQTEALSKLFNSIKTLTAKEELLQTLRTHLTVHVARTHGYCKVMTGESCTRLAIKLMTNLALGRGAFLAWDTGFSDERHGDVVLVRPMRDHTLKEVAFYNHLFGVPSVFTPAIDTKAPEKASIHRLMEAFILRLQTQFPSTVSTVYRCVRALGVQLVRCACPGVLLDRCMCPGVMLDRCVCPGVLLDRCVCPGGLLLDRCMCPGGCCWTGVCALGVLLDRCVCPGGLLLDRCVRPGGAVGQVCVSWSATGQLCVSWSAAGQVCVPWGGCCWTGVCVLGGCCWTGVCALGVLLDRCVCPGVLLDRCVCPGGLLLDRCVCPGGLLLDRCVCPGGLLLDRCVCPGGLLLDRCVCPGGLLLDRCVCPGGLLLDRFVCPGCAVGQVCVPWSAAGQVCVPWGVAAGQVCAPWGAVELAAACYPSLFAYALAHRTSEKLVKAPREGCTTGPSGPSCLLCMCALDIDTADSATAFGAQSSSHLSQMLPAEAAMATRPCCGAGEGQAQSCHRAVGTRGDPRVCITEQLCYSCRVNMKDLPSLDPLPPYVLAEAQLRSQRGSVSEDIQECLITDDEEEEDTAESREALKQEGEDKGEGL